jgi:hypothetical protein
MSDKKQTAVEYLQYTYFKTGMLYRTDFKKAKEMETQQLIEAHNYGYFDAINGEVATNGGQDER